MITVKEYADSRNITIQAVHQSMKGKRKAEKLVGHVETRDGVKWLDDEAVRILDESRSKTPVVIMQNEHDEVLEENEKLRAMNATLQEKILSLQNQLIEANDKTLLLADKELENKRLLAEVDRLSEGKKEIEDQLHFEVNRVERFREHYQEEIEQLQEELDTYKKTIFGFYKKVKK